MFRFRSGTHGLNEELGRHRGREGRKSWVDIEEGRGERSAYCVMMNVRALVMYCGNVRSTVL